MDFWHSLNGMVGVEVVSADIASMLTVLRNAKIEIFEVTSKDDLTVQFCIKRQEIKRLKNLLKKRGDKWEVLSSKGIYWSIKSLWRRPILVLGLSMLLFLAAYLPTRIFFIRVEGNSIIPSRQILEEASNCGIFFGASRREVRSEKVKNRLLEAMPELQWAGVNTSGCVATITVRERQISEKTEKRTGISSIVASRDGVIVSCTVTRGNGLCKIGQAVKAGEILISGYTDCGISIQASRAQGEVFAVTERHLKAVIPVKWTERTQMTNERKKYALIFGKKRINLYFDSGILGTDCGRMYEENYVVLPGGFSLPIAIVTEVWTYYNSCETTLEEVYAEANLAAFSQDYLLAQMVAGRITAKEESCSVVDGVFCLQGQYDCQEMIGRERSEEIVKPNGEND